ncbi:MAG: DEAD/DEAH box helicase [Lachnospiraceae bacterium]|nr:DEAD/DEAH box helicase [Lachnospiraceae bacterium]
MNKNRKNNQEEFDAFLEREILTANRYDGADETEGKEQEEKGEGLRYEDAGIDQRILRAVKELGFEHMTPIQEQAIPLFMTGRDIIGQAQTGTGKTAAFGIPILQKIDPTVRSLQALILCPTRELAMQAADELRKFARYMDSIKVLPVYGGQEIYKQIKNLKTGVQIVVGTPGRVMDHMRRHTLKFDQVHTVVLDEADEMLNMGFREDIETILKEMPGERQTGLFSATMPKPILDITKTYQKDAAYIKMTPKEVTIPLIKQAYYQVRKQDKEEVLCRLIDYYDPKRALIFCNTKRMVDELTEHLKGRGYEVEGLHGDLTQGQRDTVMNLFRGGKTNILIATDVAARGIDVSDVEAVFNFDVPEDIEYYVHRIGRTGRAGKTGRSFTLVVGREAYKIRDIERICHTKIKERKIPNAADITARKSEKILKEAYEVIESEDISRAMESILDAVALGQYSATQIAAAFMKMKLGDEPKDIRAEKFFFEKKPFQSGRGGKGGKSQGKGGSGGKDGRNGRPDGKDNKNGSRSGKSGGKENRNGGKSGFGGMNDRSNDKKGSGGKNKRDWDSYLTKGEKEKAKDKFRYENGKPKDVRRDGSAYRAKRESDYEPRYGGLRIKTKYEV